MNNHWLSTIKNYSVWIRQQHPFMMIWILLGLFIIIYYLIVITPFNYLLLNLQDDIHVKQSEATWMVKAGQDIIRLREKIPHQWIKTDVSSFTIINDAINGEEWRSLVTDVHQLDEHRVQVSFNNIPFDELIQWVEKLYDSNGLYILEANFQKIQPNVVAATLIVQRS